MKQDNSTFEPTQHFLTLIKQHQTDIACEKLKGETVVQIHRKKNVGRDFGQVMAVIYSSPHFLRHTSLLHCTVQN